MFKRIAIFFAVSLLISITVSILFSILGIGKYITGNTLNYGALMAFCLVWGLTGSFISLLLSKFIAKWTMGVQIISDSDPQYQNIVRTVHRLSTAAGLTKMPEVGIYHSDEVNAFATGPSKSNSLVALSTGLLNRMNNEETEGVIAHEVAHIANGDMVTMTLVQGIVNAFVMFFSRVIAFFISQALRKDSDDEQPVSPWVNTIIVFVLDILFGFLAMPIIAWFSRYREFRADHDAARIGGKYKMIAALKSLQLAYPQMAESQESNENFRSMQISSKAGFAKLFSSHPPLEERIKALEKLS